MASLNAEQLENHVECFAHLRGLPQCVEVVTPHVTPQIVQLMTARILEARCK